MPIKLDLGDPHGLIEIIIGESGVQDRVAVVLEERRLDAARSRLPAVKEEDGHWIVELGG